MTLPTYPDYPEMYNYEFDFQDNLPLDDMYPVSPGPWSESQLSSPPVVTWPMRYAASVTGKYIFTTSDGYQLQYLGVDTLTAPVTGAPLYSFIYIVPGTPSTPVMISVDGVLNIVYVNSVLQTSPYPQIVQAFEQFEFSMAITLDNPEAFYQYNPPIFLSEQKDFGLITSDNYHLLQGLYSFRLLGGLNIKVTRNATGVLTVDACVVNQGSDPAF